MSQHQKNRLNFATEFDFDKELLGTHAPWAKKRCLV